MTTARVLNDACHCVSMDDDLLEQAFARMGASFGVRDLKRSHPHLFSNSALFVDRPTLDAMADVVAAVERVVALPAYQALALASAHSHAHVGSAARGAFLGFDFHWSAEGPQLIEINTNAGGGILNALLRRAQRACCSEVADAVAVTGDEEPFFAMFRAEWQRARGNAPLTRIAIVDDQPEAQFLYPEFVLFQRMCEAQGVHAVIADARALEVAGGRLTFQGEAIDLVYNRVTDFAFAEPAHAALAQAWREDLAVITPHPRAHALYADKQRLVTLSDAAALEALGVSDADLGVLQRHVPRTVVVTANQREALWRERKSLFFKPQSGYGGKAAYRGDKITKGAFEEVLQRPYVAQRLVPPSGRTLQIEGAPRELKVDIRNFAYAGAVQLVCARLYQGQTTNFRTQGGGFAPVFATHA